MKTTKMLTILVLVLGLSVETANADFVFGTPTNLGPPVNSSYGEHSPDISADGLQLYFYDYPSLRPGGYGSWDIWVATRATKDEPWGEPVNPGPPLNSSSGDSFTSISADSLSLYFSSDRSGGSGSYDLWVTTRPTVSDPWGTPVNLGSIVNSPDRDREPSISADGLSLFFASERSGGSGGRDIWVTTRETTDDNWGTPVNLGPIVNSSATDGNPNISADGLWLFFQSGRPGGYGAHDLWVTTRTTIDDEWGTPMNLGPTVNSSAGEGLPSISADGSTLFFNILPGAVGGGDIWQAPLIPIVDFDSDEIVDIDDLVILIEYWGTDEPLCDIGPMPWGDGVVDVADLEVLMSYLGQEAYDSTLTAHWKLDEPEGSVAHDSAAVNDAVVFGGAVWQPASGAVEGALELDGIDDYVSTPFVLNPTEGVFSVFAWIKGGAPGQVAISQTEGADWLCADSSQGTLATELMPRVGRTQLPLISQTVITDGRWHRVGFVWDGVYRSLFVDDILVAEDSQPRLADSLGGLNIGCGSDSAAGTFWAGLIDDVRIYNRAVSP